VGLLNKRTERIIFEVTKGFKEAAEKVQSPFEKEGLRGI